MAVALTLTGCTTPTHKAIAKTRHTEAAPLFATEEEALAAAEEAYAEYQAVLDRAFATYDVEPLKGVAVDAALGEAIDAVEGFRENGLVQVGSSTIDVISFVYPGGLTNGSIDDPAQVNACLDISGTDIVDANGISAVVQGRRTLLPALVSLVISGPSHKILVSDEEIWDGENFCE